MASFDQKTKAVSLGLLPPGSKNGAPESVDVEQENHSTSDTELSTKLEGVDVEQENHSTSDTELSTKRESVDVKKEEPSTSDTKPKENMLPKPMKAKATNPNPEGFSNLLRQCKQWCRQLLHLLAIKMELGKANWREIYQ